MKFIILSFLIIIFSFVILLKPNESVEYYKIANEKVKEYNPRRKDFVIIIDYRRNFLQERLFVLELKTGNVLVSSRVTHAYNSGFFYAKDFSNVPNSKKSCYGVLLTEKTKIGKYGYSMIVKGLEKGINDNIKKRAIIFHPTYALWSQGCFATSNTNNRKIINLTHDGCLVYVINK